LASPAKAVIVNASGDTTPEANKGQAPVKWECVAGEAYAMAGGTARHNRISGNLYIMLDAATRGTPCEVFMADRKVRVEALRACYYPDVLLACEPGDDQTLYRTRPCLIVEVLPLELGSRLPNPSASNIVTKVFRDVPSALARATRLACRLRGNLCIRRTGSADSPCLVGFGMGLPACARAEIHAEKASRALTSASASLSPSDMQPGRSGNVIR